jgi:hypothetical protein
VKSGISLRISVPAGISMVEKVPRPSPGDGRTVYMEVMINVDENVGELEGLSIDSQFASYWYSSYGPENFSVWEREDDVFSCKVLATKLEFFDGVNTG